MGQNKGMTICTQMLFDSHFSVLFKSDMTNSDSDEAPKKSKRRVVRRNKKVDESGFLTKRCVSVSVASWVPGSF